MKSVLAIAVAAAVLPVVAQAAINTTGSVTPAIPPNAATYATPANTPLIVGATADGTLTVDGGSTLTTAYFTNTIGNGVNGQVTVTGVGTTWVATGSTIHTGVGATGSASLTISNGAVVSMNYLEMAESATTASATTTITNATLNLAFGDYVAYNGVGTLTLNAGGVVNQNSGFVAMGQIAGSNATLNISGAGASYSMNGQFSSAGMRLGYNGIGVVNVSNGGVLKSGYNNGTNNNNITLGFSATGNGTLNLQDGGTVDLGTNMLTKGPGTGLFNFTGGTLKNASTVGFDLVQQGGTFTAGTLTSTVGTTAVTGNYTLAAAGTLQVDATGATNTAGTDTDYYAISGVATLAGKLAILASGFTPTTGETFNVLTATTINFAGLSAPGYTLGTISGGNGFILVATAVPEPMSLAALGLGAAGVLARRRRV